MGLWHELRRRHVVRIVAVYAAAAWLVLQLASIVFPALHFPSWALVLLIGLIALGFPVAIVLAWVFEITPSGLRRTVSADGESTRTEIEYRNVGQILNATIIVLLLAAVGVLGWRLSRDETAEVSGSSLRSMEPVNSIAVLPFADYSPHRDQSYFADGVTEQLLDLLAQATSLKVVARTSAFQFRGKAEDVRKIGAALDVRHVLEGSVLRDGNQVRISVQLIDAATGYHEWSHTYQKAMGDIFAVQDEIAQAVSVALKAKILGRDTLAKANPPANADAYDEYLLGRHLEGKQTAKSVRQALAHFKKAIAIDPTYGPAYAQIALIYPQLEQGRFGVYARGEAFKLAKPYLEKAVALAPNSADTQLAQGVYLWGTSTRLQDVLTHFDKAVQLNPSYTDATERKAQVLRQLGHYREAWEALSNGAQRDPVNLRLNRTYFHGLLERNQIEGARSVATRFLAVDVAEAHLMAGQVFDATGHAGSAMHEYLSAWSARSGWMPIQKILLESLGDAGLYKEAGRVLGSHAFGLADALAGDAKQAASEMQAVIKGHEADPTMQVLASRVETFLGHRETAREHFHRAVEIIKGLRADPYTAFNRRDILTYIALEHESGHEESAAKLLDPLRARIEAGHARAVSAGIAPDGSYEFYLAQIDLLDGKRDAGLVELAKAASLAQARHTFLGYQLWPAVMKVNPVFDAVREDTRFKAVVESLSDRQGGRRRQILPILCNWRYSKDGWHPLPNTCKGVPQKLVVSG